MEEPELVGLEADMFSSAKALADIKRGLGRTREEAWDMMVGPQFAGTQVETVFNMAWPEGV